MYVYPVLFILTKNIPKGSWFKLCSCPFSHGGGNLADQVVADFPAVFFWLRQLIQMKIESTNKLIGHPNNQVVTTYKNNPLLFSDIHFTCAKIFICFIGSLMNFTI